MLLQEEREQIVFMAESFLKAVLPQVRGNISVFKRDELLFAIKPQVMEYFDITPKDVVILNLKGEVVDGKRKRFQARLICIGSFMREGRI